jgi:hypothetical protein
MDSSAISELFSDKKERHHDDAVLFYRDAPYSRSPISIFNAAFFVEL